MGLFFCRLVWWYRLGVVGGVGCILIHYVNITMKMRLTERIYLKLLHIYARDISYR